VDNAGSYQEYSKLAIETKEETLPLKPSTPPGRRLPRSRSFESPQEQKSSPTALTRTKSFAVPKRDDTPDEEVLQLREELGITGDMLLDATARLRQARMQAPKDAASSLQFMLSGVVKRNHLTVDNILVENARSVAEMGKYGLSERARQAIDDYFAEVEACLDWIALFSSEIDTHDAVREIRDRVMLVRKMKQNMGRTALMLSGGGAQAMYHLGTVRALIESQLYDDMKVISGTSGGSITAAMCALKTSEELYRDVCVSNVSTDYLENGEMKKKNIRWFPPVMEMGAYWLKHKLLVDSADFKRCCDFYFGESTFEEAFQRTGKHVCITVSASRATGGTAQRLLLNHISTPHVTLSSAVAASCALPGVMAPAKLMAKNSSGTFEPFEVDGVEWIDGSVQADLPFQRISTLFNVSNYVVCQTNFHVLPFLNKAYHPSQRSFYWRLFQTMEWDIRNRALKLSRLGLFPRIFGQDISKVFLQKYHGNLTLVPRFTAMQTFGLKALANPTVKDMEGYLRYGQIAAWPYLSVLHDMIRLEHALDKTLACLEDRWRNLTPDMDWSHHDGDDVESIASSSHPHSSIRRIHFSTSGREAESLKQKVISLEQENQTLNQELQRMKEMLRQHGFSIEEPDSDEEKKEVAPDGKSNTLSLDEKDVWKLVTKHRK
jgi:predicted acylesterase/phospholipase RssA